MKWTGTREAVVNKNTGEVQVLISVIRANRVTGEGRRSKASLCR